MRLVRTVRHKCRIYTSRGGRICTDCAGLHAENLGSGPLYRELFFVWRPPI
jgi:hypothetical protein